MLCPLCQSARTALFAEASFGDRYRRCAECDYLFQDPRYRMSRAEEIAHYATHRNTLDDPGYRAFLEPLASAIGARVPEGAHGLDFGAGPGPLLAKLLTEAGRPTEVYDPLYHPDHSLLDRHYAFVTASEVFEHLHEPREEILRLRALLDPGGWLGVMTLFHSPRVDFRHWHYRREKTHVGFYSPATFESIARWAGFERMDIVGNRIALLKRRN